MNRTKVPLREIARDLLTQARESGQDCARTLSHGARLAYRVRDGLIWLSLARKGALLGLSEIETFKAQCGVPPNARRIPAEGQRAQELHGETWHQVVFCWSEESAL
jgi:hypothetical protein